MSLYFDAINMASGYDDEVMIQDANDTSGYITKVTGSACDKSLEFTGDLNLQSTTNSVRITFSSNLASTFTGFALRWGKMKID